MGRSTFRVASLLVALTLGRIPDHALAGAGDDAGESIPVFVLAGPCDVANNPGHLDHERRHPMLGIATGYPVGFGFYVGIKLLDYGANYDTPPLPPAPAGTYSRTMNLTVLGLGADTGWTHRFGIVRAFADVGVGTYGAVLTVDNSVSSLFGDNEHDSHAGLDVGVGTDVRIRGPWFAQVGARRLWLRADLPGLAGGKVTLDANCVSFAIGRDFRAPNWPRRRRSIVVPK